MSTFDARLYPEVNDDGSITPPINIGEILAEVDRLDTQGDLDDFEQGIKYAVEYLMAIPVINFAEECGKLLEDITIPHSEDIPTPPQPKEQPKIIKEETTTMPSYTSKNSIELGSVYIRDKNSPSTLELDYWYANKKDLIVRDWTSLKYFQKKVLFEDNEAEALKIKPKVTVIAPTIPDDRDYTDEEMRQLLHTPKDDLVIAC